MNFNDHVSAHRRLAILKLLFDSMAYTSNDIFLKNALMAIGQPVSSDTLRNELQWLHEQQLVVANPMEGITSATLTVRGSDVIGGLTHVIGVARPEPV